MILRENITSAAWIFPFVLGIISVVIIMFCVRKKKIPPPNKPKLVRYIQNGQEQDLLELKNEEKTSTNGHSTQSLEDQRESQRLSSHSMHNEHRILPEIPKGSSQEKDISNGNPGERSSVNTTVSVSDSTHRSNSSPKKNRRLPALPPPGSPLDNCNNGIDATYEDLRDDQNCQTTATAETVGSGDSELYAKVSEDLVKDDFDLYAQVDSGQTSEPDMKKVAATQVNPQQKSESTSTHSSEDNLMDGQTTVTYASVDKMKKTLSVHRSDPPSTAISTTPPPPVPDRNFDDEEDSKSNVDNSQAPSHETESQQTEQFSTEPNRSEPQINSSENVTEIGPAYDTLSVRESFAHQRLRQMVEEERLNRYANTNHAIGNGLLGQIQAADSEQPQVYAQIEEEVTEAVYESVSAPGSADGTVGITGSNFRRHLNNQEGGYVTIQNESTFQAPSGGTIVE